MIRIQHRDSLILALLREQGWVMTSTLSSQFFGGNPRACSNRLRLLEGEGLVESFKFGHFCQKFWHEKPLLKIFSRIDSKAKIYRLGPSIRDALSKRWKKLSSDSMLAHQALLSHVRWTIHQFDPNIMYQGEGSLNLMYAAGGEFVQDPDPVPDLVFTLHGQEVAIELERKARRGLHRFNSNYDDRMKLLSLQYDKLLYVVENEAHLVPLLKRGDGIRNIGFSSIYGLHEVFRQGYDPISLTNFLK